MDPRLPHLEYVFLDADDTLWENDYFYRKAEDEFVEYMSRWTSRAEAARLLAEKQEENIPTYGYGSKTYFFGMMDAASIIRPEGVDNRMYREIKGIIERLTTHEFVWIDGAEDVLKQLSAKYKVVIATKGELNEQYFKIRCSGVLDYVYAVEVMERKNESDYRNLARKIGVAPENFFMAGNAVRSDIIPVISMGGWAVHIPFRISWAHELMPLPDSPRVMERTDIRDLLDILL